MCSPAHIISDICMCVPALLPRRETHHTDAVHPSLRKIYQKIAGLKWFFENLGFRKSLAAWIITVSRVLSESTILCCRVSTFPQTSLGVSIVLQSFLRQL